jgi:hypothetical protein
MITKAVIAILRADVAVTALVGNRVRPNVLKTDELYPAICVNTYRMEDLNCDDSAGVKNGVIEVWIHAVEYTQCAQIMAATKAALNDFSGISQGVAIRVLRGQQAPDDYDDTKNLNIQVIEFEAYAKTTN